MGIVGLEIFLDFGGVERIIEYVEKLNRPFGVGAFEKGFVGRGNVFGGAFVGFDGGFVEKRADLFVKVDDGDVIVFAVKGFDTLFDGF